VSTPPSLVLPDRVIARQVTTSRGGFAALEATPEEPHRATAVLVPGFTGSKEDFIAVLAPLADAGFRVVTYDQRGQYETPGPAAPEGWTMGAFAADLLAVVAQAGGDPVHLLGHSFGGLVARAAVIEDPAVFASLTLLSSGPAALGGRQGELLVRMADGLDAFGLETVWAVKQAMDLESGVEPHADPEVRAFLERRFLANDPAGLAAMARLLASEPDRTDELAATGLRTLVAYGVDDDAWAPEIQAETASRLRAAAVSFPEAAHSPAAESPKATAEALVGFWGEEPGRG
jgi:pimeloyl-ACP methyl ester carboxylesterase